MMLDTTQKSGTTLTDLFPSPPAAPTKPRFTEGDIVRFDAAQESLLGRYEHKYIVGLVLLCELNEQWGDYYYTVEILDCNTKEYIGIRMDNLPLISWELLE